MKAQRIFRIFVSSTFGDFQVEREALRDRVWPALRDFCRARGSDFQAVDLRWGVSDSAGLEHETMKICLDEIAHCQRLSPRPNFLMLVGDRYGWRPLPPAIPAAEFEQVLGCFGGAPKTRGFLHQWYRRDDNAVPAEYVLQPRPADYPEWAAVEARLLKLLRGAANVLGVTPERRELYFLSATHLEIVRGALSATVPDAEQHVMAFFRALDSLPDGERLADARRFVDLTPANERDLEALGYLRELKAELRQRLSAEPGHVFDYTARWTGTDPFITTDHLDALCRDVEAGLKPLIEAEWARLEESDAVDAERRAHEDFRRERGRVFAGREEPLAAIAEYLTAVAADESLDELETTDEDLDEASAEGGEDIEEYADSAEADDSQDKNGNENENADNAPGYPPLVLHGPGGSGKSALLARAIAAARVAHPDAVLVQRFIGASPASAGLRALLGDLCREIARAYNQPEVLPEGEMTALIATFTERLGYATPERPLIVLVDALDQLVSQDGAMPFEWLPQTLPSHVRLVLSVLDGADWVAFQRRQPKAHALSVPPATAREAEAILDALLADATSTQPARRLTDAQRQTVLDTFQRSGQPLWLKLAVIEAKRWHSDQAPQPLADTMPALIQQFFARLQRAHGPVLVERALAYLAASRHGLSDDELLEALWRDPDAHAEFDRRKNPDQPPVNALPPIIWSRLYFELEPYLIERAADDTTCYSFFHRQFGDAVRAAFLSAEQALARHAQLAAYFAALGGRDPNRRPRPRTLAELPWQQTQAGLCAELETTLTGFDFAMAKCEAGQADDLVDDYRRALSAMPKPSRPFKFWENFFRARRHILRRGDERWPTHKILLQLAVEHADNSPLTQAAERWLERGYCDWIWLRNPLRVKEAGFDPCIAVMEGHAATINGVQVLPDGRLLSWSDDATIALWDPISGQRLAWLLAEDSGSVGCIELLSDSRLASWCIDVQMHSDYAIDLWDLATSTHLARLKGHSETVQGVKQLSNDRLLSWSYDNTLRLWDLNTHKCLRIYKGHTNLVLDIESLPDGRLLSYDCDGGLRLWGLNNNRCLGVLKGHTASVSNVKILPDGRLLSWSCDSTLRLWDLTSGDCLNVLKGHTGEIYDTLMISDNTLISWCGEIEEGKNMDFTLRMWDLNKAKCLKVFEGHQELIKGVESLPDGRLLSWSMGSIYLWNLTDGIGRAIYQVELVNLLGVKLLSGRLLLSYFGWPDNILCIWDLDSGECLATMRGHSDPVIGAHILSDGHLLSWSMDRTIRIWDLSTGVCMASLKGNTGGILWVEELSNGHLLSYCGGDKNTDYTLRLWDKNLAIGTRFTTLAKHKNSINTFYFISENCLLSWSSDSIRLWNSATGACLANLAGHTNLIAGVHLFPDNRLLSWSWDGTLRLWDLATGTWLTVFEGHTGIINGVHVLADDRPLSYSSDGTLRLWDLTTGCCLTIFEGHTGSVIGVHILSDNRFLSWCGGSDNTDYTLRLWDMNRGACLFVFEGHRSSITNVQPLPGDRSISWCRQIEEDDYCKEDHDCFLRLWDLNTGTSLGELKGHSYADYTICVEGVYLLPDGRLLSWSYDDIRLWNLENGASLPFKIRKDPYADTITSVYLLAGDRLLSYSAYCTTLWVWDIISRKSLSRLENFIDRKFVIGAIGEDNSDYDFKEVKLVSEDHLLLWGMDTLYLWDGVSNEVSEKIEIFGADWNVEALTDSEFSLKLGSKYIYAMDKASGQRLHSVPLAFGEKQGGFFNSISTVLLEQCSTVSVVKPNANTIGFIQQNQIDMSIQWQGDATVSDCYLMEDGTLIVALESGHLFCIKLYRGNQRITLNELATSS